MLQAVATAFAGAEVVVHTARIATVDGRVNDRFAVSDRLGRKLDAARWRGCACLLAGAKPAGLRRTVGAPPRSGPECSRITAAPHRRNKRAHSPGNNRP